MNKNNTNTAQTAEHIRGENCKIYRDAKVINSDLENNVSIGDFSIVRYSKLSDNVEIGRRNTIDTAKIDKNTYTGEFCIIKHCDIGKYCAISWNVSIGGANHDIHNISITPMSRIFKDEKLEYKSFDDSIHIGNDVWIAAGAHILRGVKIGDGAVIAANAVVTHDVEPYSIVGGVPAKKISQRFDDNIISRLLSIKWWDFSEDKLIKAKEYFRQELTDEVLDKLEEIKNCN